MDVAPPPRKFSPKSLIAGLLIVAVIGAGVWLAIKNQHSPARYNRRNVTTTGEELSANFPWLAETLEYWQLRASGGAKLPGYADLAAFPIGNGKCFAITGLHWPLGTLSNIIGPGYQKRFGFFGTLVPWLRVSGKQMDMPEQSIAWCANAPVVVVHRAKPHDLSLDIYYCAPIDSNALVAVVVVTNTGQRLQRNIQLALTSSLPAPEELEDGMAFSRGTVRLRIGMVGAVAQVREDLLPEFPANLERRVRPLQPGMGVTALYDLGALSPGQSVGKLVYLVFSEKAKHDEDQTLAKVEKLNFNILESAHTAWRAWSKNVANVSSGSKRVDEWLQAQEYIILAQRSECGAFSPMHGYTFAWVRDSNGPLRFFSAIGATNLVKDHLEYHFRACVKKKAIGNNVPLDLVLPRSLVQPDWSKIPVEQAEVPSFVVLQHYWYYRVTGDTTLIKWHKGMLLRCIYGQALDARKTLPFHGDETYRFPGYELFNAGEDIKDWVCLETRSADSAFEFVAAAEALAEMIGGQDAQKLRALAAQVRQATEKLYWQPNLGFYAPARSDFADTLHHYPFANINLRPLWVGYASAATPRQQQNVLSALKCLWQPSGIVRTTPSCGYFVGMTPGYVLYDLAEIAHPAARRALDGMLSCAEASGGYAEMLQPSGRPADRVWGLHRARPWEGGINAEALLHALTGYAPDAIHRHVRLRPLLLCGPKLSVKNLPLGLAKIDVSVSETRPGRRRYVIAMHAPGPAKATVDLSVVVWGTELRVARLDMLNPAMVHQKPGPKWPRAQEIILQGIQLDPNHPAEITVTYSPAATATASLPTAAFHYPTPTLPSGIKAVVLTPSAEKLRQAAAKYGAVYAVDTKIPWPPEHLRKLLLDGGRPRVPVLVLDVEKYPGAFKRAEFWESGEGAKIVRAFEAAGGQVERVANPSPPPASRAGLPSLATGIDEEPSIPAPPHELGALK